VFLRVDLHTATHIGFKLLAQVPVFVDEDSVDEHIKSKVQVAQIKVYDLLHRFLPVTHPVRVECQVQFQDL
jgi:hypothetical protein